MAMPIKREADGKLSDERTMPAYLRLRVPRLTSTLARPNTLAGNGLRPRT